MSDDLRYPVGRLQLRKEPLTAVERRGFVETIAACPGNLRNAIAGLNEQQLEAPYRDGGWTVRQVVHHVPESHMNAYMRHKLALTEDNPTIKPYEESEWAKTGDVKTTPIDVSLTLLESLHARWDKVWASMRDDEFARTFVHPDHGGVDLDWLVQMYAWHSRHHVGHINALRTRNGW